jgi:hypothetical protein
MNRSPSGRTGMRRSNGRPSNSELVRIRICWNLPDYRQAGESINGKSGVISNEVGNWEARILNEIATGEKALAMTYFRKLIPVKNYAKRLVIFSSTYSLSSSSLIFSTTSEAKACISNFFAESSPKPRARR